MLPESAISAAQAPEEVVKHVPLVIAEDPPDLELAQRPSEHPGPQPAERAAGANLLQHSRGLALARFCGSCMRAHGVVAALRPEKGAHLPEHQVVVVAPARVPEVAVGAAAVGEFVLQPPEVPQERAVRQAAEITALHCCALSARLDELRKLPQRD